MHLSLNMLRLLIIFGTVLSASASGNVNNFDLNGLINNLGIDSNQVSQLSNYLFDGSGGLRCYHCMTNALDGSDPSCRTDLNNISFRVCNECNVIKFEHAGDDIIFRTCNVRLVLSRLIHKFETKVGSVERFGMKWSWSSCNTNMCNSYAVSSSTGA